MPGYRSARGGVCLALLIACMVTPTLAAQGDERLDELFVRLRAAPDVPAAQNIETEIWAIWMDSGREEVNELLDAGVAAMSQRRLPEALEAFDRVVAMAPEFAEGWNKRATVYWLMDRLSESVADIRRTLALEPRHFGALSGMGLIFLESGDAEGALGAFEAVLAVSPQSAGARYRVDKLRERLGERQI